ncbi:MAG: glycosyltransferase [Anaerolineaceae bacterium]|nr:MAG: glycosyltransferase [Anaerolineaceae bacterium]
MSIGNEASPSLNPLRIAYILGTFPQLTQTFVTREIFWIRSYGVEVQVFSLSRPESPPADEQVTELLPLVHYSPFLSISVLAAQIYFFVRSPLRYLRALVKVVRFTHREPVVLLRALMNFPKSVYFARQMHEFEVDHVHAHFITLAAISASVVSELLGVTYSVHAHAVGLFQRNLQDVRRQLEDASRVITISTYHRAHIAELSSGITADEIDVVYCSLETERFRPNPRLNGGGPIRLLSIGRLIEKKGFEYLIDACALLVGSGLEMRCRIAGAGPLQEALQARIDRHGLQGQVTLLGAVEQEHILELYRESDAFVLACVVGKDGNRDGLPVVLIEAMSCGLPVISTPVAGITDLIQPEETGILVEQRDSVALAEAMKELILDGNRRKQLGRRARQKVEADFQIQQNAARLATIFGDVASNSESRT